MNLSDRIDYFDLHIGKSQEWVQNYIKIKNLAWFSSFFKYEYSNSAVFTMLHILKYEIGIWLNSQDKNPFEGTVTLKKEIGFITFNNDFTRVTKQARVILTKDTSCKKGYKVTNCFPCITESDYRFRYLQRMLITYFHSEWIYDNSLSTDYRLVIEEYKNNSNNDTIYYTVKELEVLVECFHWGEKELLNVLKKTFCCAINPEAYGLTCKEFIVEILVAMKEGGRYQLFDPLQSSSLY